MRHRLFGVPYRDLADRDEDDRITAIGEKAMGEKLIVAFITDAESGKAERYIAKLKARFPGIKVIGQWDGPVPDTVTVKVGPPEAT